MVSSNLVGRSTGKSARHKDPAPTFRDYRRMSALPLEAGICAGAYGSQGKMDIVHLVWTSCFAFARLQQQLGVSRII